MKASRKLKAHNEVRAHRRDSRALFMKAMEMWFKRKTTMINELSKTTNVFYHRIVLQQNSGEMGII